MRSPGDDPSTRQNAVVGRRTRSLSDPRLDRVRDDMLRTVPGATDMARRLVSHIGLRAAIPDRDCRMPREVRDSP
jgi:hypothetical protein